VTVLDLMLLLSNFPTDAEIKLLTQVPGSEAITLRVELADPLKQARHERGDWFDEEITQVDPSRSRHE
jgi:hypothetical protein